MQQNHSGVVCIHPHSPEQRSNDATEVKMTVLVFGEHVGVLHDLDYSSK